MLFWRYTKILLALVLFQFFWFFFLVFKIIYYNHIVYTVDWFFQLYVDM